MDEMPRADSQHGELVLLYFFLLSLLFIFCKEEGGVSWVASEVSQTGHKSRAEDEEQPFLADAKSLDASTYASMVRAPSAMRV